MNKLQTASMLLSLCPIPQVIQDMIFGILLCDGTPSSNAIKGKNLEEEEEIPIKVVALGPLNRCRHTLYYMEQTVNIIYDNASYFSREALIELHIVYLKEKRTTAYTVTKIQALTNHLNSLIKERLVKI